MHASVRLLSERAHRPLISFVGKRVWPASPAPSHPHPAAPPEYRQVFSSPAQAVPSPTKSPGSNKPVFQHYWEAPPRLWHPRYRNLEDGEIDAILTGGASLR
ncbi:hypothetical protein ID866_1490 [Astraeus odoratus]|nr:hypothetical protein ID866_1490 [Astraeus odoratus]